MAPTRKRAQRCKTALAGAIAMALAALASGCAIVPEKRKDFGITVTLPFMRMEAGECYFIDDFMPTPDNMVSGRSGGLWLRY
jgi:hypothetical protein